MNIIGRKLGVQRWPFHATFACIHSPAVDSAAPIVRPYLCLPAARVRLCHPGPELIMFAGCEFIPTQYWPD